jgi:hypothetical protein
MRFPRLTSHGLVVAIHVHVHSCNGTKLATSEHDGRKQIMPSDTDDRLTIRAIIENWVLWRDARQWDRFRTLWHPEGQMWATWFQGSYEDFIKVSQEGWGRGARIMHMLGGMSIDINGDRALAQTKTTIFQRAKVEEVLCDVACSGRFYDFLERRQGRWGIVLRRLTYEQDRLDPVDPSARPVLDQGLLAEFPEGYRHLAYLQTKIGYKVKRDLPGLDGPELEALNAQGEAWLKGRNL